MITQRATRSSGYWTDIFNVYRVPQRYKRNWIYNESSSTCKWNSTQRVKITILHQTRPGPWTRLSMKNRMLLDSHSRVIIPGTRLIPLTNRTVGIAWCPWRWLVQIKMHTPYLTIFRRTAWPKERILKKVKREMTVPLCSSHSWPVILVRFLWRRFTSLKLFIMLPVRAAFRSQAFR